MGKFDGDPAAMVPDLRSKVADGGGGRCLLSAAAKGWKIAGILFRGVSRPPRMEKKRTRKWQGDAATSPGESERDSKAAKERLERLWEFLEAEMSDLELDEVYAAEAEEEMLRKEEELAELQSLVRRLQAYEAVERERDCLRKVAATELRKLAKDDANARETLAMLGAIPPLVEMLDSDEVEMQVAALYALLNLGIGNNANKSAIVAVGAVNKMVKMIGHGSVPWIVSEAVVANFLGLSALDANKHVIGSSGAVPFLVQTFRVVDPSRAQARLDAIRALLNLAIAPENGPRLVDAGLVPDLLAAIGDMSVTEKVLSVLSCVVSTVQGRTAVSRMPEAFHILVDVLNWADSPECQQEAAFVLTVMAHKSYGDRRKMIEAGIVSPLLELALVGTSLAQNRASGLLECLRSAEGEQHVSAASPGAPAVSAPATDSTAEDQPEMCEREAVNLLVQQSLLDTTRRILRRANIPPADDLSPLSSTVSTSPP